jgi:hypothetical protein
VIIISRPAHAPGLNRRSPPIPNASRSIRSSKCRDQGFKARFRCRPVWLGSPVASAGSYTRLRINRLEASRVDYSTGVDLDGCLPSHSGSTGAVVRSRSSADDLIHSHVHQRGRAQAARAAFHRFAFLAEPNRRHASATLTITLSPKRSTKRISCTKGAYR